MDQEQLTELSSQNIKERLRELQAETRQLKEEMSRRQPMQASHLASRVGGSFAPPIGEGEITAYASLAHKAGGAVGESMLSLISMLRKFNETPRSKLRGEPHPSGVGVKVPLEAEEVQRIFDVVPWPHEIEAIQGLFDGISSKQKDLRNAAFHLLWFAKELVQDREPITSDYL